MYRLARITSLFAFLGFVFVFLEGCSEDAKPLGDGQELTQAELQTILETDDITGSVDTVLAELFAGNTTGKIAQKANECYTVEQTQTGFVAIFNNCVLNGTENINGTLTVTYALEGETISYTATYVDFYVGTLKLNGTRTFVLGAGADQNSISFTVTSDLSVVMEDESVITENGTKTFSFTFGDSLENSSFSISGEWTITASGNTYSIKTIDDLQGSLTCEHLVSGSMEVSKNGLKVTVDFGDGQCDAVATVTYPDGTMEEIEL
ncbi:hypothetical protein [Flagellimonas sp.]|uniref:hypothetical protein n=1 Tax=Flagellimonas sp. TaxID=2058762 RepID=UPI003B513724